MEGDNVSAKAGEMAPKQPVSLVLRDFSLSLMKQPLLGGQATTAKQILYGVTGTVAAGEFLNVIGGSGCGKTSLLNCLAMRLPPYGYDTKGEILYNGRPATAAIREMTGYVLQTDFLLFYLTVRETLSFASRLRLPSSHPRELKRARVESLLLEMGLKDCAETLCGRISGGEKRRLSTAVQMVTDPTLLFADEPTTGLDAFTARSIVESFRAIASSGRTVICTIHQPRADIFGLFDSTMLLSKGRTVYFGPTAGMVAYFSGLGHACPTLTNPADYFLDLSSVDNRTPEAEEESAARVRGLVEKWERYLVDTGALPQDPAGPSSNQKPPPQQQLSGAAAAATTGGGAHLGRLRPRASAAEQALVLAHRGTLNQLRDSLTLCGLFTESVVIAVLCGAIFYQLDDSLAGITSRNSLLYLVASLQCYQFLVFSIYSLVGEICIFDHESEDGMYGVWPWVGARVAILTPILLVFPTLFSVILYYMAGLREGKDHILIFIAVMIVAHFVAFGYALFAVSLQRSFAQASLIGNSIYTFLGLASGFLVQLRSIPVWLRWIQDISFINFAFRVLINNEFKGRSWPCPPELGGLQLLCGAYDGDTIILRLGVQGSVVKPACAFLVNVAVLIVAAGIILKVRPTVAWRLAAAAAGVAGAAASAANSTAAANGNGHGTANGNGNGAAHDAPPSDALSLEHHAVTVQLDPNPSRKGRGAAAAAGSGASADPAGSGATGGGGALGRPSGASSRPFTDRTLAPVVIELRDVFLTMPLRRSLFECGERGQRTILKNITVEFLPSVLTGIMGASGCGKSSLLNMVAARIRSKGGVVSGSILFNGEGLPEQVVRNVVGYVTQHDYLLPLLTVSETLTYSARLRMPAEVSDADKLRRVGIVIQDLGLKDCKNTVIGADASEGAEGNGAGPGGRGVSGGEKRRVSIAVQMLTDPSVLFLDEPTSGLDSFTALNIGNTLWSLAHEEGRTVVATVHQPRAALFNLLDSVLLLSRGRIVYWGPGKEAILDYFNRPGHACPPLTNPADFYIDLASIDVRDAKAEAESEERVSRLVEHYRASASGVLHRNASAAEVVGHGNQVVPALPPSPAMAAAHGNGHGNGNGNGNGHGNGHGTPVKHALLAEAAAAEARDGGGPVAEEQRPGGSPQQPPAQAGPVTESAPPSPARPPPGSNGTSAWSSSSPPDEEQGGGAGQRKFDRTGSVMRTKRSQMAIERPMGSIRTTYPLLLHRSAVNMFRQPPVVSARIMQGVSFGVILCLFYARIGTDYVDGLQDRVGLLYEYTALIFVGMLNCIAVFPAERNVFYREAADGAYSAASFVLTYTTIELPCEVLSALIYTAFAQAIAGLHTTAYTFFVFTYCVWCVLNAGESIGILFCACIYHVGFGVTIMSTFLSFWSVMSGFFSINMPEFLVVINHASILKYLGNILAVTEFTGVRFTCHASQRLPNGQCPIATGEAVISLYGFEPQNLHRDMGIMALLTVAYRLIAYAALDVLKQRHFK